MIGKQVTTSLKWLTSAKVVGQIFAAAASLVVIRILEPSDYGLMAMATVILGLILLLNEMGLGSALVQQKELSRLEMERVFGLLLLVNIGLALLLCLAAPLVAAFFDEPRVTPIIQVLALKLPLMALLVVPRSILRREMLFKRKSMVDLARMLVGSATTLVFAVSGFGVWSIVYGILAGGVAQVIGTYAVSPVRVRPRFSLQGMHKQLTFGGWVTVDSILWYGYTHADIVIVGRMLGHEILGVYSVAKRIVSMPLDRLGGMVKEVGFSAYSSANRDGLAIPDYYCKAARMASFFAFPVFFGAAAIAPDAVPIILGEKWVGIIVPLQLLALTLPLRQLNTINTPALMGVGRPDVNVVNLLFACAIMPLAFLIGARWGLIGVCLAWVIAYPAYFLIMLARSLPVLGVRFRDYFQAVWPSAVTGAAMVGVVETARIAIADATIAPAMVLLLLVALGTLGYGLAVLLFNRAQLREVLAVIRR